MHFIPNPANTEFIYLTGLEECVNRILNLDAVTPPMPKPFTCSQCHTDFTPTWKWDKAAKGKSYFCEVWQSDLIQDDNRIKTINISIRGAVAALSLVRAPRGGLII